MKYAALACVLAAATSANATVWFFSATLNGAQEVPPVPTPGLGSAIVTLDDVTGAVTIVNGTFTGLVSPATAAHIHGMAPAGVNAGVIIGLSVTAGTSGTLSGGGTLTGAQIPDMLAGLTYINVHTGQWPGGEIRGQLIVIPAPGAMGLLAAAGLLALRRRR